MLALAGVLVALPAVPACGTGANSPDSCRSVEEARCRQAAACNIPLEPPYSTSGNDVDACIRFYDVACLHGLEGNAPSPMQLSQCVAAIKTGVCTVVANPQIALACSWLIPPATAAAADATVDAVTEAAVESGTTSDAGEDAAGE